LDSLSFHVANAKTEPARKLTLNALLFFEGEGVILYAPRAEFAELLD